MSRVFILAVIVVLLFGGVLAADQALQNPDLEPANASDDADQEQFAETGGKLLEAAVPPILFTLVAGAALVGVRALGGA